MMGRPDEEKLNSDSIRGIPDSGTLESDSSDGKT